MHIVLGFDNSVGDTGEMKLAQNDDKMKNGNFNNLVFVFLSTISLLQLIWIFIFRKIGEIIKSVLYINNIQKKIIMLRQFFNTFAIY